LSEYTPNFSSVSVAAQDVSPISALAATSPAVAAKKFANVQELVNQILLCRTWIDLVETVGENASLLKTATKTMTHEERRGLPRLLADYLCFDPTYLTKLSWVPVKLRDKALQPLTFTIQRLGGTTGSVLDACIEYRFWVQVCVSNTPRDTAGNMDIPDERGYEHPCF
jgi:hypothetical protein